MRFLVAWLLLVPGLALGGQDAPLRLRAPALAGNDPARLCETAIATAEFVGRLPPRLLGAIGLTESGRVDPASGAVRAWPWTINANGEGRFFPTIAAAIDAVQALQERGVQSIDVGCLQVNLMYHPHAFASLRQAFDPGANAIYAARFLNGLYAAGHDWSRAIAAYHSDTPALGDAYRTLVLARWRNPRGMGQGWLYNGARGAGQGSAAYRDFAPEGLTYGAFLPPGRVYGAFEPSATGRDRAGR